MAPSGRESSDARLLGARVRAGSKVWKVHTHFHLLKLEAVSINIPAESLGQLVCCGTLWVNLGQQGVGQAFLGGLSPGQHWVRWQQGGGEPHLSKGGSAEFAVGTMESAVTVGLAVTVGSAVNVGLAVTVGSAVTVGLAVTVRLAATAA